MLIRNAKALIGQRFHEDVEIRIHNGCIQEIGSGLVNGLYEDVVDLNGDYLLPGFVDVHIHAYRGHDTMQGQSAIRAMSRDLFKAGVSAFLPTTMSASVEDTRAAVNAVRNVMAKQEIGGARVLGTHMEAPFLNAKKAGAQLKEYFMNPAVDAFEALTGGKDAVKIMTMAPELPGSEEFIHRMTELGITISVGHTAATAEQTHLAADWGATHVTHTFNAQTPLQHRDPGVPGAALTDDRLYAEMICDGVHLHRDTVRLLVRSKGVQRAVAITDAMEAAGLPDGEYQLGGQKVYVHGAEARLEDGTLAGSVLTMQKALWNLIHLFDISPVDAALMCTATPADSIGEKLAGRIVPGSPAPLTRWNEQWEYCGILY